MSSVVNVQNVVECLNVMIMNEQFQEENRGRSSTAPPTTNDSFKKCFSEMEH